MCGSFVPLWVLFHNRVYFFFFEEKTKLDHTPFISMLHPKSIQSLCICMSVPLCGMQKSLINVFDCSCVEKRF